MVSFSFYRELVLSWFLLCVVAVLYTGSHECDADAILVSRQPFWRKHTEQWHTVEKLARRHEVGLVQSVPKGC
jgi:hypothetical protein